MQMEVRPDPAEVGRARRWARSRLVRSGVAVDEPLAETLILLISELVTNAVVHTGCPAVLRMLFPTRCAAPPAGTAERAGPPVGAEAPRGRAGGTDGAQAPPSAYSAVDGEAMTRGVPVGGTVAGPLDGAGAVERAGVLEECRASDGAGDSDGAVDGVDGGAVTGVPGGSAGAPAWTTALPGTGAYLPAVETVRVEVADASTCPPRPRCPDDDDTHGRGLELVDGLADRWGWRREGNGKSIWCEVDRQGVTAGAAAPAGAEAPDDTADPEPSPGGAHRSGASGSDGRGAAPASAPGAAVAIERTVSLTGACTSRRRTARQM